VRAKCNTEAPKDPCILDTSRLFIQFDPHGLRIFFAFKIGNKLHKAITIIVVCYFLSLKIFYIELTQSSCRFHSQVTLKFHLTENCICYYATIFCTQFIAEMSVTFIHNEM
jgi:hypothetical protein